MVVLMGGSGSTGSSLLKNILNRHTAIFAGEESNLFCKKELYTHFNQYKHRMTKRGWNGLKNHGWHIYNGIDLYTPEYNLTPDVVEHIASKKQSFPQFIEQLQTHICKDGETILLEKTPANATSMGLFLQYFDTSHKVIHITRHPQDTIASLVKRGYNLYYATGIYLINTAAAIVHQGHNNFLQIKYEDLVLAPHQTVTNICTFLGLAFDDKMLQYQGENIQVSKLEGWNYDETQAIGTASVSRFGRLPVAQQVAINTAIQCIRVNSKGLGRYQIQQEHIQGLAEALGYEMTIGAQDKQTKHLLLSQKRADRWQRVRRAYPSGWDYPLDII